MRARCACARSPSTTACTWAGNWPEHSLGRGWEGHALEITANSLGWDTVFSLRLSEANRQIDIAGSTPEGFSMPLPDNETYTLTIGFGRWALSERSSGTRAHLTMPLDVWTIAKADDGTVIFDGAGSSVDTALDMEFVAADRLAAPDEDFERYHLRLASPQGRNYRPAQVQLTLGEGVKDHPDVNGGLRRALETWLNTHLDVFDHIFAELDITTKLARGDFAWMQPTDMAYAFSEAEKGHEADAILAVLCMTGGRKAEGRALYVSGDMITIGHVASLVIGSQRLLDSVVVPMMCSVFQGIQPNFFELDRDGMGIRLMHRARVKPTPVLGMRCETWLDELSIRIEADQLAIECETKVITPLGAATNNSSGNYGVLMSEDADGNPTLSLEKLQGGFQVSKFQLSVEMQMFEKVAMIAGATLGVMSVLAPGPLLAGFCIGLAIVAAVSLLVLDIAKLVLKDIAPSFDGLFEMNLKPLRWTGLGVFEVTEVTLSDSLRLAGYFPPPETDETAKIAAP
ncbi:TULIP family P47-like protein [Meridianimarinicoccus roseus]|uniref:TULIP family P47-like protein n=1 Tax=Meridianimarinicoccus roseus TaxID=2072018 RepID=UPI001EE67C97|nr:TULIP family P47-like protein [Meridianimarinicoccus roseus]